VLEIRPCASRADEQASLDVYNAVWAANAITMDEVDSFNKAAIAHIDALGYVDRILAGSGYAAIRGHRPKIGFGLITVLPEHRRRGLGTAFYRLISHWGREHELEALDVVCPEDDPESIAFAERRGFVEAERNGRLVLELNGLEPPPIAPPDGVEITTWAERPDLARGIYDVAVEAAADVPGRGRDRAEPFEHWLEHDMKGAGNRPDATFVAAHGDQVVGYGKLFFTAAQRSHSTT
jgi:GNAT superfamily N-acetyltransferase